MHFSFLFLIDAIGSSWIFILLNFLHCSAVSLITRAHCFLSSPFRWCTNAVVASLCYIASSIDVQLNAPVFWHCIVSSLSTPIQKGRRHNVVFFRTRNVFIVVFYFVCFSAFRGCGPSTCKVNCDDTIQTICSTRPLVASPFRFNPYAQITLRYTPPPPTTSGTGAVSHAPSIIGGIAY